MHVLRRRFGIETLWVIALTTVACAFTPAILPARVERCVAVDRVGACSRHGGALASAPTSSAVDVVVLGKVIVDEFSGENAAVIERLGGGSVQAAYGARAWGRKVGLVAPVGEDTPVAGCLMSGLLDMGVDVAGVAELAGFATPRSHIRYEGETMTWVPGVGWDRWQELLQTALPVPPAYCASAQVVHVLTEGRGWAEVDMAVSLLDERPGLSLSVEPVLFGEVSPETIRDLSRLTRRARVVSPDWEAACKMAGKAGRDPERASPREVLPACARQLGLCSAAQGGGDVSGSMSSGTGAEPDLGGQLLSVRRGSQGSYLWSSRHPGRCWTVPAVPGVTVADPTGAGNAFCGALAANLPPAATRSIAFGGGGQGGGGGGGIPDDTDGVLRAAARASATGAAVVAVHGLPPVRAQGADGHEGVASRWLLEESDAVYGRIHEVSL